MKRHFTIHDKGCPELVRHILLIVSLISLAKVDPQKFELDFHDIERSVLDNQPGAKKVIRLLKHLRDVKGGYFFKLWSHLLKTVVMNEMKK